MTGISASPYVKALDDIQKALTGFLIPLGFKKKGRTYNRQVGDGLVQVVDLQMGHNMVRSTLTLTIGAAASASQEVSQSPLIQRGQTTHFIGDKVHEGARPMRHQPLSRVNHVDG